MATTFSIGYIHARWLRKLAESRGELAAVDRLERGEGDEADVRLAAALYQRNGEGANAADLLRML